MSILFHLKMVTSLNNHQFLGHGHSCKLYPLIEPWAVTAIALPRRPWPTLPPKPMKRMFTQRGPTWPRVCRSKESTPTIHSKSPFLSALPHYHLHANHLSYLSQCLLSAMRHLSEKLGFQTSNCGMLKLSMKASFLTCKLQTANESEGLPCVPGQARTGGGHRRSTQHGGHQPSSKELKKA